MLNCLRYYGTEKGADFNAGIERAIVDIVQMPQAWPRVHYWDNSPTVRSREIQGFRERIVYYERHGEPVIIAYAHPAQEPGYWARRIETPEH